MRSLLETLSTCMDRGPSHAASIEEHTVGGTGTEPDSMGGLDLFRVQVPTLPEPVVLAISQFHLVVFSSRAKQREDDLMGSEYNGK